MKKIFKDWSLFEISFLSISIIIIAVSGVIFKAELISVAMSVLAVTVAILQAKGKVLSQCIGLLVAVLYSIISFKNKYYGEVIIYITLMIPLYILSVISWIQNKNKETQTVNKGYVPKKEWIVLIFVNIVLFTILYQILKALNTSQLLISSLSMITSVMATYLISKRSKYSFLFYLLNDIILILLWGIPVIQGNFSLIPVLLDPLILFINDIYGFKNWSK